MRFASGLFPVDAVSLLRMDEAGQFVLTASRIDLLCGKT